MESVYHIVTIHVNETSWAHVWRLRSRYCKAYRVKRDIPQMEMVHHQDVAVELSARLLTAQYEIETLRAQL
jgi:hypothetical protein